MTTSMLLSFVFVFVGSSVFAAPFDHIWSVKRTSDSTDPTERCDTMKKAVEVVIDDIFALYKVPVAEEIFSQAMGPYMPPGGKVTEQHVEDMKMMILPIVCNIAKATSLQDLANVVMMPVEHLRGAYGMVKYQLSRMGDKPSEIVRKHDEMCVFLLQELEFAGFPQWPLQMESISNGEIVQLLEEYMPSRFGNNWVKIFFVNSDVPNADEMNSEVYERIAQGLRDATSTSEAASAIKFDRVPPYVAQQLFAVFELISRNPDLQAMGIQLGEDVIAVLKLVEAYGLLDLN